MSTERHGRRVAGEGHEPILVIDDLTVRLPEGSDRPHAISKLSLTLAAGELVCIVGESGSGKSVTASMVMQLSPLQVERGSIKLEGEELVGASQQRLRKLRGDRMAMIFQEPMTALNPTMRVGDQVAEAIRAHASTADRTDASSRSVRERVRALFEDVMLPDPERLMRSYPSELSGGQRQRVMIAMALALDPVLLIADEPTTALDVTTQATILELLKDLQRRRGTAVLFITHDFGVVADVADRVLVMQHGVVVEQGGIDAVLYRPTHAYTRKLIGAVPGLAPRAHHEAAAAALLEVRELRKTYGRKGLFGGRHVRAVDGIDFNIPRGHTLGIVGESGSGKSTAARCVARLLDPTGGSVRLGGQEMATLSLRALHPLRRRVQVIFQDPYRSLNPRRTIGDSMIEGPTNYGSTPTVALDEARRLLRIVGLDASALERYPHQFSGGQRQRIAIARALAMQPELLIADEAVSALDVSVQAQVLDLLESVREQMGLSMLFITHDLRVAARMCDQIAVMQRGAIVELAQTAQLFAAPQHAYTRQLLGALPGRAWLSRRDATTTLSDPT
ncbi:MAG: microcin ABC transporter ATP-binding protein [Variovorax paradoxus]|nr:MAG: microcin ABC transporter ATP-binding protein [Variovorax paradoxus]PZQ00155.1 MAG: microcin ABC transporter ATP-binding protein [Variovorax paradoxus]